MLLKVNNLIQMLAAVVFATGATMSVAQAEGTQKDTVSNAKWKDECGCFEPPPPPKQKQATPTQRPTRGR